MLAQILRTDPDKPLYVNLPLLHEVRTNWDGQYQRQMAFALLAQGATASPTGGRRTASATMPTPARPWGARAQLAQLRHPPPLRRNHRPHARQLSQGGDRQHGESARAQPVQADAGGQPDGRGLGRLLAAGLSGRVLRENDVRGSLDNYSVVFVPGVRFADELDESVVEGLKRAAAAGVKVIVEQDSASTSPASPASPTGRSTVSTWARISPPRMDDELNKVYLKSQPIVDYLGPKLREWNVEPAATGPFKVGPTWRQWGRDQLPRNGQLRRPGVRPHGQQQMAKPVVMPLTIPTRYGRVAYDLLARAICQSRR